MQPTTTSIRNPQFQHGFTLVEISIVLVILGLVAGGIFAGQSLLHSYELRSIVNEKEKYVAMVNSYTTRYNAYPGDHATATDNWGISTACSGADTSMSATCSGNGNGVYEKYDVSGDAINETLLAWQHLSNAGLVDGTYSGLNDGLTQIVGQNVPEGKIGSARWLFGTYGQLVYFSSGSDWSYVGMSSRTLEYSGEPDSDGINPIISAADTLGIDIKIDDGKPLKGILRVNLFGNPNCTDASILGTPGTAFYEISVATAMVSGDADYVVNADMDQAVCTPIFYNAF
ncbi:MAG: prepilin-type N-terminal cleavage/methylation domain-containing protein [Alphaproteobacteria bacterium]|nr:prepilin-type N-terminal cleavage/methylation domain-containing protein [Alphaproteobacteria bacterium]